MAAKRPVFTENFSANLTHIREFLGPDARRAFQRLLARLFDETVPTLCEFLQPGRKFLTRPLWSAKAGTLEKKLRSSLRKGDDLRELIVDEHLVLYLIRGNRLVFLSIKHHRQLSLDLQGFWQEL